MGRHSRPPSRVPRRVGAAVLVMTAGGLTVSDTSGYIAPSPADILATPPIGLPVVPAVDPPTTELQPVPAALESPTVQVPAVTPAPPRRAPAPLEVVVQPGDTLTAIGARHGQTWQDLWRRNLSALPDPSMLRPGQVLSLVAPLAPLPVPQPVRPVPAATDAPEPSPAAKAPVSRSGIVGLAEKFIGTPYRWGGKSSAGVDCSGLVYLVLKQAGLTDRYRTSGALREWTTPIKRSEARAGDLVFGPGHVGIYVGDGMMIDAPKPGAKVGLRRVYSTMTSFGRIPTT